MSKGSIVPSFFLICTFWIVGILFIYAILWRPELLKPFLFLKKLPDPIRRMGSFFICLLPIFLYTFHRWSEPFGNPWIRIFLYTVIILAAAWLLTKEKGISGGALIASTLTFSVSFLLINQFRDLTDYPFSVGWSEGNRFWDYSVLFGRRLYNWPQDKPIPAYIDLGRQSLWGAIFLLPKVTIRMMRAWNDFLFTIPYALLGWALLNYRSVTQKKYLLAGSLWAMIFLNQGPIYTPLVLAAILVALGHKLPLWLGCLFTFLAGAYAVMSRSTWIVAPAIYGGMLTLADAYDKKILSQKKMVSGNSDRLVRHSGRFLLFESILHQSVFFRIIRNRKINRYGTVELWGGISIGRYISERDGSFRKRSGDAYPGMVSILFIPPTFALESALAE